MLDDTAHQRYPMSPRRLELTQDMMQHFVEQWQAELDWVKRLREQEVTCIEADSHGHVHNHHHEHHHNS